MSSIAKFARKKPKLKRRNEFAFCERRDYDFNGDVFSIDMDDLRMNDIDEYITVVSQNTNTQLLLNSKSKPNHPQRNRKLKSLIFNDPNSPFTPQSVKCNPAESTSSGPHDLENRFEEVQFLFSPEGEGYDESPLYGSEIDRDGPMEEEPLPPILPQSSKTHFQPDELLDLDFLIDTADLFPTRADTPTDEESGLEKMDEVDEVDEDDSGEINHHDIERDEQFNPFWMNQKCARSSPHILSPVTPKLPKRNLPQPPSLAKPVPPRHHHHQQQQHNMKPIRIPPPQRIQVQIQQQQQRQSREQQVRRNDSPPQRSNHPSYGMGQNIQYCNPQQQQQGYMNGNSNQYVNGVMYQNQMMANQNYYGQQRPNMYQQQQPMTHSPHRNQFRKNTNVYGSSNNNNVNMNMNNNMNSYGNYGNHQPRFNYQQQQQMMNNGNMNQYYGNNNFINRPNACPPSTFAQPSVPCPSVSGGRPGSRLRKKHGKVRVISHYNKKNDMVNGRCGSSGRPYPWRYQGGVVLENVYDCISVVQTDLGIPSVGINDISIKYKLFRVGYFKPEGVHLLPRPEELHGKAGPASPLFVEIQTKVTSGGKTKNLNNRKRIPNKIVTSTQRKVFVHNPAVEVKDGTLRVEFRLNNYDKGKTKGINHFVMEIYVNRNLFKKVGYFFKKDNRKESKAHTYNRMASLDLTPIPMVLPNSNMGGPNMMTMAFFPRKSNEENELTEVKKEEKEESISKKKIRILKKHIVRFVGLVTRSQESVDLWKSNLEKKVWIHEEEDVEEEEEGKLTEEGVKEKIVESEREMKIFKKVLLKSCELLRKYEKEEKQKQKEEEEKKKED